MMRFLFFACLGILALWLGGFLLFLERIPTEPEKGSDKVDAIVTLTGGSGRIVEAIKLLQEGKSDRLFISGVGQGITLEEIWRLNGLEPDSLPDDRITLGYAAQNTGGNAVETARWAKAENIQSIRLVTAHYHMPRAIIEFNRTAPQVAVKPHPVFPLEIKLDRLWSDKDSLIFLIREYHKYLLVWQGVNNSVTLPQGRG